MAGAADVREGSMKIVVNLSEMNTLETAAFALIHVSCEQETEINGDNHTGTIASDSPGRAADILHAFREVIGKARNT